MKAKSSLFKYFVNTIAFAESDNLKFVTFALLTTLSQMQTQTQAEQTHASTSHDIDLNTNLHISSNLFSGCEGSSSQLFKHKVL